MEFTVRGREPDVTHRTSWLESTGECVWQPFDCFDFDCQHICTIETCMLLLLEAVMLQRGAFDVVKVFGAVYLWMQMQACQTAQSSRAAIQICIKQSSSAAWG